MKGLTERQARVIRLIQKSIEVRGYPPTLREIGAAMGIRSTNGIVDHLRALERKGYITRDDMAARGIRLTGKPVFVEPPSKPAPWPHDRPRNAVVYFAQSLDDLNIKIGWTVDLRSRAKSILGAGNVVVLATVAGSRETERLLHERFESIRLTGEWFRPTGPLIECISALRRMGSEEEKRAFLGLPAETSPSQAKRCGICGETGHNAATCEHQAEGMQ